MPIPADLPVPRPPVGSMADIPIERPSVGGMGMNAVPMPRFKPYVYRGTGEDQYPQYDPDYRPKPPPKPKPEPRPERRPKPKPKRKRKPRPKGPRHLHCWAPMPEWFYPKAEPEPNPFEHLNLPKPMRPSPGWKPLSGDDLDAMLNEIGEEEP
jgi:hypothetical protein